MSAKSSSSKRHQLAEATGKTHRDARKRKKLVCEAVLSSNASEDYLALVYPAIKQMGVFE